VLTIGDLAAYSVSQEAVIVNCDLRRRSLVGLIDAYNGKEPDRPWWRVW